MDSINSEAFRRMRVWEKAFSSLLLDALVATVPRSRSRSRSRSGTAGKMDVDRAARVAAEQLLRTEPKE